MLLKLGTLSDIIRFLISSKQSENFIFIICICICDEQFQYSFKVRCPKSILTKNAKWQSSWILFYFMVITTDTSLVYMLFKDRQRNKSCVIKDNDHLTSTAKNRRTGKTIFYHHHARHLNSWTNNFGEFIKCECFSRYQDTLRKNFLCENFKCDLF